MSVKTRHPWLSEYEESFCCVPKHAGAGEGGLDYWTVQVPDAISMEKINSSKWSKRKTGDGPPSWTSEIDGVLYVMEEVTCRSKIYLLNTEEKQGVKNVVKRLVIRVETDSNATMDDSVRNKKKQKRQESNN